MEQRNRWHNAPKKRGSTRTKPLRSGLERSQCLMCTNGWRELPDGTVVRCEACAPGTKTRQERPKCQRCGGQGMREIGRDVYGQCARCDGSGVEPEGAEPDDNQLQVRDHRAWYNR